MITHQLINLRERGVLNMQPVCGDTIQSRVIQHHLMGKTHTKWHHETKRRGKSQFTASIMLCCQGTS